MSTRTDTDDLGPGVLETDAITVRTLTPGDLDAVVRIDAAATGSPRQDFFRTRIERSLRDSTIHLSLAAILDDHVVGFLAATFYYGEFGRPEPTCVVDALGVHPEYRHRKVAAALMRQLEVNLRALRVSRIRTEVDWNQLDLLGFFAAAGFAPGSRLCLEKPLT